MRPERESRHLAVVLEPREPRLHGAAPPEHRVRNAAMFVTVTVDRVDVASTAIW